ncbi:MAG: hypothetical protein E7316_10320 [Clostridiales bacterium]|nr:hypothetical protein [Clostridiales bacterium]
MAKLYRVKCSCGNVINAAPGNVCPKCGQPLKFPEGGMISLYRKGSPLGVAGGFDIYINNEPFGHIGNRETVHIPVSYGTYNLHVAVGMSRRCTDLVVNVTPENRQAYAKVWMRPGFWTNSFVIEPATGDEMPAD